MYKVIEYKESKLSCFDIFTAIEDKKDCILLESSLQDGKGRYNILAYSPYLEIKESKGVFYLNGEAQNNNLEDFVKNYLKENFYPNNTDLPFLSAFIGYFSYDYGRKYEQIKSRHQTQQDIADAIFRLFDIYIIEDLRAGKLYISYQDEKKLIKLKQFLKTVKKNDLYISKNKGLAKFESKFSKEEYKKAIQKTIDYIIEGDIYIMNMTQKLEIESKKTPLELYSYLRKYNPAPFAAYMDNGDYQIISASPERFISIKDKIVETVPIKGTRKRGKNKEEDNALRSELINSEKDKSELLMIVDLERNDLNRVCETKSVEVSELFKIEEYATVFHLVSTIKGRLRDEFDILDLMKSSFPGGSITGAPKIRAMEIIDELEKSKRDVYTGSLGYISMNGNADFSILIRTALYTNGKYYMGVGGGITYESDLDFEYEETLQKAKSILEALSDE